MNDRTAYYLIAQMTEYIKITDYGDEPSMNKGIIAHICDIKVVNAMRDWDSDSDQKIKNFDITSDNAAYDELIDYLITNYKL